MTGRTDGKGIYTRLSELEDNIEDGTLIELPCKEFNPAYFITQDEDGNEEIVRTHHWEWAVFARICGKPYYSMQGDQIFEYGEDVFATEEEAEARLAELSGNA